MTLAVDIAHRQGSFLLETRFESVGRLTALFGPSGSGKSSLINIIAGLARPERGRVAVDGRVLVDTEKRVFVPRHKRRVGLVFQDARLFPHMSVAANLRYGRFFTPAAERYAEMDAVVDLLGIGHLLDRRPSGLSGGEKQRVAIGRALLASPKLLLMDEPLASLDEARKAEIVPYVERLRDETKIPIVYVSHTVAEVARLASDVVMLSDGKVVAAGRKLAGASVTVQRMKKGRWVTVGRIATGKYYLRLSLPERHATQIRTEGTVLVGRRGMSATANGGIDAARPGGAVRPTWSLRP